MIQFFTALLPLLGGFTQPIKDFFSYKAKEAEQLRLLKLAKIEAESKAVQAQTEFDTARLGATSREFKQHTFYFLTLPIIFSVIFPSSAHIMWDNFNLIPEWVRYLFTFVYSAIWGLPVAKDYFGLMLKSIGKAVELRREFKLAKLEKKTFYNFLRNVKGKLSQDDVKVMEKVIDDYNR